tara:strand:+ start:944 stop:1114 length:171 start_codon:yes stop_codon:yes gene_type:complete
MNTVDDIREVYATWTDEDDKFREGNKAAGTRARNALLELRKLADVRRKEIQAIKNG